MAERSDIAVKTSDGRLARRAPFDLFEALQDEMERFWGRAWPWPTMRPLTRPTAAAGLWAPRMDVFEKNSSLVVKVELPGANKDDIKVSLEQGDLVISGERKAESEVKEEHYYRLERSYGNFYRRLPLPYEVKPEQVKATFKDGVLEITMPKPAETQPQPQAIKISS